MKKLSVGQKASRSLTLTAEYVKAYAEITGDYNPLHFDETFTAKTKFKNLTVQGGLTTGLLHALVLHRAQCKFLLTFLLRETLVHLSLLL